MTTGPAVLAAGRQVASRRLDSIFNRQRAGLIRLAMRFTSNQADAEDVVQEAFATAVERTDKLLSVPNWSAWLATVVRRKAINWALHSLRRRQAPRDPALLPALITETSHLAWCDIDAEHIRAALLKCPAVLRKTFELRYVDGLPYRQIAERLSIPVATVSTRLRRARHYVRHALEAALAMQSPERPETKANVESDVDVRLFGKIHGAR